MPLYNGFPATYTPYYQQYQQQGGNNGPLWVQGEAGAKSYLVAPNNTVVLFDSESQTIFLKSADASGMPSMKVLDYTVRETAKNGLISPAMPAGDNGAQYATKAEIEPILQQITALEARMKKVEASDE